MARVVERGRAAFERQAWAEAYELLTAAVQQGPVDDAEDHERLAVAAYLLGKDEESDKAWERAHHRCLSAGEPDRAARCAFWLGFSLLLRGEGAPASGWLTRAARLVTESRLDCTARGFLLVTDAFELLHSNPNEVPALAEQAAEIGKRFDDSDLRAFAALLSGEAAIALGDNSRGIACLDEAMVAVTAGEVSPIPAGIVYCAVIEACMEAYDLRRAAEWTQALSSWCDTQPDLVPFRGQCLVHRSQVLMGKGAWPAASDAAERACRWLAQPPHPALGLAFYQQAELHRLRGEIEAAAEGYRKASQLGMEPLPGLALLRLANGEVAAAVTAIRRAVEDSHPLAGRPMLLAAYVETMLAARDVPAARAASDELSELAASLKAPVVQALAAHAHGSVLLAEGDARAAVTALRDAAAAWRVLDMPYEVARSRALAGLGYRELGDADAAGLELAAARAVFVELGASPDLARLDQLAVAGDGRVARALTDRECEVLRLVATGKSNRAIAADLVISEHTVGRHVQNIFTKLGLSSRAAATAYAYEHGLV